MTPAFCRFSRVLAGAVCAAALLYPLRAAATLEADPAVLYTQMKNAYDKAALDDWDFRDQEYYLATIFNAGRAYSLQHPSDPAYGQLATLAIQVGAGLHYDPLTNHDAAAWYVREAAEWVEKNSGNPSLVKSAADLLARVNSEGNPEALARFADGDAAANAAQYPKDMDAQLQQVEANWRGWILTNDPSWRSLAFERAAQPEFPIAHLPTSYGPEFIRAVQTAAAGVAPGFTQGDKANAATILAHLSALNSPLIIASVTAVPHAAYLTTLAPADEYFGRMGYSVLGIENELKRINYMLNYNYGNREASQAVLVAQAIDDMHKVYPRDRDMPMLLLSALTTLQRMTSPDARAAAARMRTILTVEYQDSPEARKVLEGST